LAPDHPEFTAISTQTLHHRATPDDSNPRSSDRTGATTLARLKKSRLTMPDGHRMARGTLVCRGAAAHLFVGAEPYAFTCPDGVMP
jgi:hypothetical protein